MEITNCCSNYDDKTNCICVICTNQLDETVVEVNCAGKHYYHCGCIEEWLIYNFKKNKYYIPQCPLCRGIYDQYGYKDSIKNVETLKQSVLNTLVNEYDIDDDNLSDDINALTAEIYNLRSYMYQYRANSIEDLSLRDEIRSSIIYVRSLRVSSHIEIARR
jgi:hypothetical protein